LAFTRIVDIQDVVRETLGCLLGIDDVIRQVALQQAVRRMAGFAGLVRLRQANVVAIGVGQTGFVKCQIVMARGTNLGGCLAVDI